MKICLFLPALVLFLPWSRADEPEAIARTKNELLPHPVTIKGDARPVQEVLTKLFEQTGNRVVDRRQHKKPANVKLDIEGSTFWPALEALAGAAGCAVSPYQADGQIALVDGPSRPTLTIYQGIFRLIAKRVGVARDDVAGTHMAKVTIEIAWEPRYEPLYLDLGELEADYSADARGVELKAKAPAQGRFNVAGRNAIEVDMHLAAPARSAAKIQSLQGRLQLIGPGKMLTFSFKDLSVSSKPLVAEQEEVRVAVSNLKKGSDRWRMDVDISNPPGPVFESYQSWLGNNRIALEKTVSGEHKTWQPRANEYVENTRTATHAAITYSFLIPPGERPGSPADWTLVYRTPGRIVELEVPFAFKDIPLP